MRHGIGNKYPSLSTIFSFAEQGTKETNLSLQSPSTSKSNTSMMKPKVRENVIFFNLSIIKPYVILKKRILLFLFYIKLRRVKVKRHFFNFKNFDLYLIFQKKSSYIVITRDKKPN